MVHRLTWAVASPLASSSFVKMKPSRQQQQHQQVCRDRRQEQRGHDIGFLCLVFGAAAVLFQATSWYQDVVAARLAAFFASDGGCGHLCLRPGAIDAAVSLITNSSGLMLCAACVALVPSATFASLRSFFAWRGNQQQQQQQQQRNCT